jgi:uncharacterized cupredoxin-like copper-binding protein
MHRPVPPRRVAAMATLTLIPALGLACGSGSDDDARTSGAKATSSSRVSVRMTDFAFAPKSLDLKTGKVTISAPNRGKAEHEFVVVRTSKAADALPVAKGRVEEDALDSVGEIEGVEPGDSKSHDFKLTAGRYVYLCNEPGHYQQGMRGTLVVR